jgi:hypothetical protein
METRSVQVGAEKVILNMTLQPSSVYLSEVVVSAGEDPAYDIIRNAIDKREHHLNEVKKFSCKVYAKGKARMNEVPDNYLADKIEVDSTREGIVYLSESVSKLYYEHPDKKHEEMISSKVSGSNQGISFNFIFNRQFSFYENMLDFRRVAPRGLISPIADNALFYYNYKLQGKFEEHGQIINKIKVIPKRKHDPVFQGHIFITDSTWRIHSVDFYVTQRNGIEIFDTVTIKQNHVPVNDSIWQIFSQRFTFDFQMFGFSFDGQYLGIYKNYDLSPQTPDKKMNNELLRVDKEATEKDSAYWAESRPVQLLEEEKMDYKIKDSLQEVYSSKEYQDSLDAKRNKPQWDDILLWGYVYRNSYENYAIGVDPLISSIQYNTVEGAVVDVDLEFRRWFEEPGRPTIEFDTYLRYGFANSLFSVGGELNRGAWSIGGGSSVEQYNDFGPITPLANSIYSLFVEENHMKLYQKKYVNIGYSDEVLNGVEPAVVVEYSDRSPLENSTDYTWIDYKYREFTENRPQVYTPETGNEFESHRAFVIDAALKLKFGQKYITLPDRKIHLGTRYPKLVLFYRKGVSGVLGSSVNFDFVGGKVYDQMNYKLLGYGKYAIRGGGFVNHNNVYFMDRKHFNGNQTVFASDYLNSYQLMDYYSASTVEPYVQLHYQHHFKGFLFNKIPVLRNWNWNVVGGVSALYTPGQQEYIEASAGIENILEISNIKLGRVDFFSAFSRDEGLGTGFRFKIDITSDFIEMN